MSCSMYHTSRSLTCSLSKLQCRHRAAIKPCSHLWSGGLPGNRPLQEGCCSAIVGWQAQCKAAPCAAVVATRSSSRCSGRAGSFRHGAVCCYSTTNPTPAPAQHIPWLQSVDVLQLTALGNCDHAPKGSNSNGSSAGHSIMPRACYSAITEADLQHVELDAIMVLAGGLTPEGGLPEYVHRRLDVARGVHCLQHGRPPVLCLGGGTPHKPSIIGPTGHVLFESTSCAAYLMATGVPAASILKETSSFDTVGNAYFSLTMHAIPAAWTNIAVVTSHFHMARSRELFSDMYRTAGLTLFNDANRFRLTFFSASDAGVFDDHVYSARLVKEAASLAHWQAVAPALPDLAAIHNWLFSDHLCYAVQRQHDFGKRTIQDPKLLESY